jgi:hypothetical protein
VSVTPHERTEKRINGDQNHIDFHDLFILALILFNKLFVHFLFINMGFFSIFYALLKRSSFGHEQIYSIVCHHTKLTKLFAVFPLRTSTENYRSPG